MEQISAPFTDDQVKGLNEFQKSGSFHEFTCGNLHHPSGTDNILIATNKGWVCPNCGYRQFWAWKEMADGTMIKAAEIFHTKAKGGE